MRVLLEGSTQDWVLDRPPLARGGEAAVHALAGAPGLVAKVYHRPTAEHADKLAVLIAAGTPDTGDHAQVAWPTGRLLAPEEGWRVVGCVMPRVADARPVCELYNPRARRRSCPLFHYGYLLRAAHNLAAAVRGLHERGFVLGDLNESNVLVTPRAHVTLVDADSFQVASGGRVFRCRVGRAEFSPPELQGAAFADVERRPEHDNFALAVLLFQLLMQGTHPFAGMFTGTGDPPVIPERIQAGHWPYAWERTGPFQPLPHAPPLDVLPPVVRDLFSRCFEEGHGAASRRPSAAEWQLALDDAGSRLATCRSNTQHRYPRGLDVCPWCVLARRHDHDPFPSPAELRAFLQARHEAAAHVPPATPEVAEVPALDPDDPLPPGAAVAAVQEEILTVLPVPTVVKAVPVPANTRATQGGWAPWIAAAAVGALLGIVVVLWRYQPAPHIQAAPAEPLVASVEQQREAVAVAEKAYRDALQEFLQARREYDVLEKEYMTKVAPLPPTRINQATVAGYLARMREQLQLVRDRERMVTEKRRQMEEARLAQKTS